MKKNIDSIAPSGPDNSQFPEAGQEEDPSMDSAGSPQTSSPRSYSGQAGQGKKPKIKFNKASVLKLAKNPWVILAIIVLIIVLVVVLMVKETPEEKENIAKNLPIHDCSVGQFKQAINKGETSSFEVFLDASRFWRKYSVKMGNLPKGVTANVNDYEGRGDGKAQIDLSVSGDANPASYSLVIVYEEEMGGEMKPTYCQYNLVIK
jgi:hypothetical protein